jgi:hypothetical protein
VQTLRRSEDLAAEAVRDHDVVADGDAEQGLTPRGVVRGGSTGTRSGKIKSGGR